METNAKQKEFDAVKFMRTERNRISNEISNMSFQELKEYLVKKNKEEIKPCA